MIFNKYSMNSKFFCVSMVAGSYIKHSQLISEWFTLLRTVAEKVYNI